MAKQVLAANVRAPGADAICLLDQPLSCCRVQGENSGSQLQRHIPAIVCLCMGGHAGEGVSPGNATAPAVQAAAVGSADGAASDTNGSPACSSAQKGRLGEMPDAPDGNSDAAMYTASHSAVKSDILDSDNDMALRETACWLPGRADLLITDLLDHRWHSFNLHTQALWANVVLKSKNFGEQAHRSHMLVSQFGPRLWPWVHAAC